jgi:hypothetical protein
MLMTGFSVDVTVSLAHDQSNASGEQSPLRPESAHPLGVLKTLSA